MEIDWDRNCAACGGTGKNSDPSAADIGEQQFRLRRRAEQFLIVPPVANRLRELRDEWEELKQFAAERGNAEVFNFDEFLEYKEGDSAIVHAYQAANTHPPCGTCQGVGKELTDAGKKLLEFLKRESQVNRWPPEDK